MRSKLFLILAATTLCACSIQTQVSLGPQRSEKTVTQAEPRRIEVREAKNFDDMPARVRAADAHPASELAPGASGWMEPYSLFVTQSGRVFIKDSENVNPTRPSSAAFKVTRDRDGFDVDFAGCAHTWPKCNFEWTQQPNAAPVYDFKDSAP